MLRKGEGEEGEYDVQRRSQEEIEEDEQVCSGIGWGHERDMTKQKMKKKSLVRRKCGREALGVKCRGNRAVGVRGNYGEKEGNENSLW